MVKKGAKAGFRPVLKTFFAKTKSFVSYPFLSHPLDSIISRTSLKNCHAEKNKRSSPAHIAGDHGPGRNTQRQFYFHKGKKIIHLPDEGFQK